MVFASNGDLYFGTVSVAAGQPTRGIWKIRGAAYAGAGQKLNPPEAVLSGTVLPSPIPGSKASVEPGAFLSTGPFTGDLLVAYDPSAIREKGTYSTGEVLRVVGPNYTSVRRFIATSNKVPSMPSGITLIGGGDVLVTDFRNGTVLRYGPTGNFKRVFAQLDHANQLTVDSNDIVYVTNAVFQSNKGIVQGGLFLYDAKGNAIASASRGYLLNGVTTSKLEFEEPEKPPTTHDVQNSASNEDRNRVGWNATIVASIIGAVGTVIGAIIGAIWGGRKGKEKGSEEGFRSGLEQGRRHSILRFMDVQGEQLDRAEVAVTHHDYGVLTALATAIVDTTYKWREIQQSFSRFLNGRIDEISASLKKEDPQVLGQQILALKEEFVQNRMVIETLLERSQLGL